MAKRRMKRSAVMPEKSCKCANNGHCLIMSLIVISLAFFVITVWPAAMTFVHSVHWGYWLGIAIILGIICKMKYCR